MKVPQFSKRNFTRDLTLVSYYGSLVGLRALFASQRDTTRRDWLWIRNEEAKSEDWCGNAGEQS
jgi:hypothetical protein